MSGATGMGANQSNNNNDPGGVLIASSCQGSKTITKVKTHVDSPATLSAMSTDEPQYQKMEDEVKLSELANELDRTQRVSMI